MKIAANVLHARRHDADDGEGVAGELKSLADDAGVSLKMSAPEAVAQNDDVIVVLVFLFFVEVAAERGVITEDAKIFVGDAHAGKVLGTVAEGEVEVALGIERGAAEYRGALAIVVEVGDGHGEVRLSGPDAEDTNELAGL